EFRVTQLREEITLEKWRETHPNGDAVADLGTNGGALRFLGPDDTPRSGVGIRLLSILPARPERKDS
ncbi:MAG: sodium:proton antiporter, partial [Rhodobacterales bacterium]